MILSMVPPWSAHSRPTADRQLTATASLPPSLYPPPHPPLLSNRSWTSLPRPSTPTTTTAAAATATGPRPRPPPAPARTPSTATCSATHQRCVRAARYGTVCTDWTTCLWQCLAPGTNPAAYRRHRPHTGLFLRPPPCWWIGIRAALPCCSHPTATACMTTCTYSRAPPVIPYRTVRLPAAVPSQPLRFAHVLVVPLWGHLGPQA